MPKHEHFEELAAIAALGELDPSGKRELEAHLAECPACKGVYDEYAELHAPLRGEIDPETDALIESRRPQVRGAVLQSVAAKQAMQAIASKIAGIPETQRFPRNAVRIAGQFLATAAAVALAFWMGVRYERNAFADASKQPTVNNQVPSKSQAQTTIESHAQITSQEDVKKYAQLVEDLRMAKRQNVSLDAALSVKVAQLVEAEHARAELRQRLGAATADQQRTQLALNDAGAKLKQLETAKSSDADTLVALRYQVQELAGKLNEQTQSLDRERALLASGREVRDIIGARNLHIIDVYDADPKGNTKKSFARAFYTEGKSLIFYAYDLPARRGEEGKFVYTAWGERNGNKDKVLKLGILLNDDKAQKRWAFNFSDPKTLAEIDSVFVTLERVGVDKDQPSGKRMLTAYLASQVNHP